MMSRHDLGIQKSATPGRHEITASGLPEGEISKISERQSMGSDRRWADGSQPNGYRDSETIIHR
jgi:hypothetical protein